MKPLIVPLICGTVLAAMSAAGVSHWWSVSQFIAAIKASPPVSAPHNPKFPAATTPVLTLAPPAPAASPAGLAIDPAQRQFFEALIAKMEKLQNQNRDLLDQVAETNRDMMKLEFRVDTHSASFRPMPVSEDRPDTSFDDGPGVLPPRAEPVSDDP
jgi:cytochrome c-type biogenesis protein CcmH/NrfF